ncbi:3-mercaptopyruvate sulfurtransferase [Roseospira marina]|uniref:Sulfurtransferase n=1 Tax=Roseospira marina TaxID=140057 RepID=A0A5M6IEQ6_9PROT|nr:3-mercaptopyruvate sulfurtransferase [Roseospira marina]KAA5606744.1 3-mercaptopyruvate sulfurtransferase [Roseospira marina]MBB4313836.1 thiosulfate/3-mercaptopyruvate sulfurtransferase [Roseospira marina]MBB5086998.1 thiosulfate/3-mercaptopyruvate sulfurtransferase [Roseospira marina]
MPHATTGPLVTTDWLAEHLTAPDVRIVDARFYMPGDSHKAAEEYARAHIPGAVFFDIDAICDPSSTLPHMLPSPELFSSRVRDLGLGDGHRIVVYDHVGGACAAARVWWMFRAFGHREVCVLDGGLPKWQHEGRPVDDREVFATRRHFTARMNAGLLARADDVLRHLEAGSAQVLDVRGPERFRGEVVEPRPSSRAGHMPGAINAPFGPLQTGPFNQMAAPDVIQAQFKEAGVDLSKPIVTSCGSGVTACYSALALACIGRDDVAVYDGSWAEWGDRVDLPVTR